MRVETKLLLTSRPIDIPQIQHPNLTSAAACSRGEPLARMLASMRATPASPIVSTPALLLAVGLARPDMPAQHARVQPGGVGPHARAGAALEPLDAVDVSDWFAGCAPAAGSASASRLAGPYRRTY